MYAIRSYYDIAIDCHGRMSTAMAIRFCKAMEPYNPVFIEEPVLPENVDALVKVKEATVITSYSIHYTKLYEFKGNARYKKY